jgi:hypothetical protein
VGGTCGAAARALATAHLLLRLADALPGIGFPDVLAQPI